jgi:excisionase family DNA binding protein
MHFSLDAVNRYTLHDIAMKRTYSTEQAAKMVGIHPVTLRRWLAAGRLRPSLAMPYEGRTLWRWNDADVERLDKYKATHHRKGRGRKKGKKSKV